MVKSLIAGRVASLTLQSVWRLNSKDSQVLCLGRCIRKIPGVMCYESSKTPGSAGHLLNSINGLAENSLGCNLGHS